MIKGIIFLALTYLQQSSTDFINLSDTECGDENPSIKDGRIGRIVGGVEAAPGQFPWLVSLRIKGMHWCGGSVLSKKWVLTAAHCVYDKSESSMKIMAAVHDVNEALPDAISVNVKKVVIHEGFVNPRPKDDIALVQVASDIPWSENIKPACLSRDQKYPSGGANVTIAGWGWTHESPLEGSPATKLLKLDLPVVERSECQQWYEDNKKKLRIPENSVCAGTETGGKDACQGDSGGPMMMGTKDKTIVVGVVSAGYGCARPRLPGLYTQVSAYIDWIIKHVNEDNLIR